MGAFAIQKKKYPRNDSRGKTKIRTGLCEWSDNVYDKAFVFQRYLIVLCVI